MRPLCQKLSMCLAADLWLTVLDKLIDSNVFFVYNNAGCGVSFVIPLLSVSKSETQ